MFVVYSLGTVVFDVKYERYACLAIAIPMRLFTFDLREILRDERVTIFKNLVCPLQM